MSSDRKTLEERAQMTDIERLRHSSAHVMATAILRLWPDAQFAYGPPIENGFYYDFEMKHRVTPDDFEKIEAEMKKIAKENQKFESRVVTRDEAMTLAESGRLGGLTDRPGNPSRFKLDLIEKIPLDEPISCYQNGDFIDLCAGPHVGYTSKCKNIKLMSVSSSFYMGDESRGQLQRVYGTAFESKELLEDHLQRLEEAKRRDHRRLGRELGLFHIDEMVGQGLILWKPKGALVRRSLQEFITQELDKQGYSQVFTPHIGKLDLYRTSGHFPYYQESQYPAIAERDVLDRLADEDASCASLINGLSDGTYEGYLLKPMNCPHHIKIYASEHHSYRDLPVRLAEFGTVYRWEQSGELGGMTRVRGFTQDDAHLFCTPDQVAEELTGCLDLVKKVFHTLGMNDYRVRLSLRDPASDKYVGSAENWDKAEAAIRHAVKTLGVEYTEELGEAAFYGPKIDFVVKDVIGRDWQLGTVQVDYTLPVRFGLTYIGPDNAPHVPVMIHRAPFGSLERFTGLLIEHFEGKFPAWLAPEQVRVIPISEKTMEAAEKVTARFADAGIRVSIDRSSDKVGAKIRNARLERVPYMVVLGQKEVDEGTVSIRQRDSEELITRPLEEFLESLLHHIATRQL
ncbi:MAG: threonine--tRNA ligase [Verrucomicrobia bacterium]|nr:MAG: threonine--tRNA ligase [Verrucomicrobiota bacterium]